MKRYFDFQGSKSLSHKSASFEPFCTSKKKKLAKYWARHSAACRPLWSTHTLAEYLAMASSLQDVDAMGRTTADVRFDNEPVRSALPKCEVNRSCVSCYLLTVNRGWAITPVPNPGS